VAQIIFTDPNTNLTIAKSIKQQRNHYIITTPSGMRITLTAKEMAGVCLFSWLLIQHSRAEHQLSTVDGIIVILEEPPNV